MNKALEVISSQLSDAGLYQEVNISKFSWLYLFLLSEYYLHNHCVAIEILNPLTKIIIFHKNELLPWVLIWWNKLRQYQISDNIYKLWFKNLFNYLKVLHNEQKEVYSIGNPTSEKWNNMGWVIHLEKKSQLVLPRAKKKNERKLQEEREPERQNFMLSV